MRPFSYSLSASGTMAKLLAAFFLVLGFTAVLGGAALQRLGEMRQASSALATLWLPATVKTLALRNELQEVKILQLQLFLAADGDADHVVKTGRRLESALEHYERALADYSKSLLDPQQSGRAAELGRQSDALRADQATLLTLVKSGRATEARAALQNVAGRFSTLDGGLAGLAVADASAGAAAGGRAETIYARARVWIIALLVGAVAAAVALAHWLARAIAARYTRRCWRPGASPRATCAPISPATHAAKRDNC